MFYSFVLNGKKQRYRLQSRKQIQGHIHFPLYLQILDLSVIQQSPEAILPLKKVLRFVLEISILSPTSI
jgi:hypothetical protein